MPTFGDVSGFNSTKKAANYVGITPSNWSSGTMNKPRRAISKEGPAPLRLAFYQAGSVARTMHPQLAAFYHRLMTEHGHGHTQPQSLSPGNWAKGPGKPSSRGRCMGYATSRGSRSPNWQRKSSSPPITPSRPSNAPGRGPTRSKRNGHARHGNYPYHRYRLPTGPKCNRRSSDDHQPGAHHGRGNGPSSVGTAPSVTGRTHALVHSP